MGEKSYTREMPLALGGIRWGQGWDAGLGGQGSALTLQKGCGRENKRRGLVTSPDS